ncbi:MAG: septum formation initiator family protein [Deltaproteobacteria bacterium]|nr:septum formation initiator family protein [Deltaproteobacteria bacterium]
MEVTKKKFLKFFFIAIVFLGLIITWLGFGDRGFYHLYRMEQERRAFLEKIRRLEAANQSLLEQIERLQKDKEYIESVARRELNLVKKDEIIYRFEQDQKDQNQEAKQK